MHGVSRYELATIAIDAANALSAADLRYSEGTTRWLQRLDPNASEALRLAVRAQHIRRSSTPRSSFPNDRAGYLKWRSTLAAFHANETARILTDVGYDPTTIAHVQSLIRKERIKTDPEAQTLEDAACLLFLETEFPDFLKRHDEAKLINILRRTWAKMSPRGHELAMALLPNLPQQAQDLLRNALQK